MMGHVVRPVHYSDEYLSRCCSEFDLFSVETVSLHVADYEHYVLMFFSVVEYWQPQFTSRNKHLTVELCC